MIHSFSNAENKLFYHGVRHYIGARENLDEDDRLTFTGVAFFDAMPYQDQMSAILQMSFLARDKWKDQHIAAFLAISHVISDQIEVECDENDSEYWRDLFWEYALEQGWTDREQTREEWVELVHNWMVEVVGTAEDDPYYLQTPEEQVLSMCERYVRE